MLDGDASRFSEIVLRHDRRVRAVVAREVRDPASRDDVVARSFYLAFRHLGQLDSPSRLDAWLVRIALNCAREHRRRARPPAEAAPETLEAETDGGAAPWIWEEVAQLAPPFQQVLRLRYAEGLSYAEIAERLSLPASTVRGRIYEARRALRQRLVEE